MLFYYTIRTVHTFANTSRTGHVSAGAVPRIQLGSDHLHALGEKKMHPRVARKDGSRRRRDTEKSVPTPLLEEKRRMTRKEKILLIKAPREEAKAYARTHPR